MSANLHEVAMLHRLSVADYHHMGEVGILGPELRTELIEGEIIEMTPIGPTHGGTVNLLGSILLNAVRNEVIVSIQNPIRLDDYSEPQPDLAVLRRKADFYRSAHPGPADILLIIEVADTTLRYDRDVKLPLYARAGIPEAWLVDLQGCGLTACRKPLAAGYAQSVLIEDLSRISLPLQASMALDLSALL